MTPFQFIRLFFKCLFSLNVNMYDDKNGRIISDNDDETVLVINRKRKG